MELPSSLIKEFAQVVNTDKPESDKDKIAYGSISISEGESYVRLDGSDVDTPVSTTTSIKDGERVMVLIEKHTATVIGNVTSPAATGSDLAELSSDLSNISISATSQVFTMESGSSVYLPETITLTCILRLVNGLENIKWYWSESGSVSWHEITTDSPSTTEPYLNPDMTLVVPRNTSMFATSGNSLIFKAAYVEENVEKYSDVISIFRVKDVSDGAPAYSVILSNEAVSITTTNDMHPLNTGSYSCGVTVMKGTTVLTPVANNSPGDGQFSVEATCSEQAITLNSAVAGAVGFTTDTNEVISSNFTINLRIRIGGLSGYISKSISVSASPVGPEGEGAVGLRIDSSRGLVFKNDMYGTVLTVTVNKGADPITDLNGLRAVFGNTAHLQWYSRTPTDTSWQEVASTDSHLTNNGFTLTKTPADVDHDVSFQCDLVV